MIVQPKQQCILCNGQIAQPQIIAIFSDTLSLLKYYSNLVLKQCSNLIYRHNIGVVHERAHSRHVTTRANLNLSTLFYFTIPESQQSPFVFVLGFLYFCTQTPLSNLALAACQVGIVTFLPEKQFFIPLQYKRTPKHIYFNYARIRKCNKRKHCFKSNVEDQVSRSDPWYKMVKRFCKAALFLLKKYLFKVV